MKKLLLFLLVLAGGVSTASATDYYVGANTKSNGEDWAIQGQMTDEDGDGTYTLIIQVPARVYVTESSSYFTKFYLTIFSSSTIAWENAYRPVGGEKWFNNNTNEIELSSNSSLNDKVVGYGSAYEDDENKNYASALKLEFTPSTMKLKATRLIAVISANNGWETTKDYLTETSNGSKIYTGKVELTTSGYKFFLRQLGWDYYGKNGGAGYIVNAGGNETVVADGIYELTAHLSDFVWNDPTLVTVPASVGTYGMATLCSEYALDFTGIENVKAYTITSSDKATGDLTKNQVTGKVPANTGLYIEGDADQSANIPTTICTTSAGSNMLVGVTENTNINQIDGTFTNYILTVNKAGSNVATPKFFKVNEEGNTVLANKAYLQIPTASAAREYFWFDDEATSINAAKTSQPAGEIFDLQGRRVAQPTKGLYIVNGKKFFAK